MQDDEIRIRPALPEHEALIRTQSAATNDAHRARLPHVFYQTNSYQDQLLDAVFDPELATQIEAPLSDMFERLLDRGPHDMMASLP